MSMNRFIIPDSILPINPYICNYGFALRDRQEYECRREIYDRTDETARVAASESPLFLGQARSVARLRANALQARRGDGEPGAVFPAEEVFGTEGYRQRLLSAFRPAVRRDIMVCRSPRHETAEGLPYLRDCQC